MSDGPFGRRSEPVSEPPRQPVPAPPPPAPPRGISSVTWILGVALVLGLAYITLNTLRTDAPGSRGVEVGTVLPEFAAPLATGDLVGDAQVDPKKACRVRGADILNSCALAKAGRPVALAFLADRSRQCEKQIDVLDRVRPQFPSVQFAAVGIRGERAELAKLVRERGWQLPVAHDRDGAVANLFAVAVCPTITFADFEGKVVFTSLGVLSEAELTARLERMTQ